MQHMEQQAQMAMERAIERKRSIMADGYKAGMWKVITMLREAAIRNSENANPIICPSKPAHKVHLFFMFCGHSICWQFPRHQNGTIELYRSQLSVVDAKSSGGSIL